MPASTSMFRASDDLNGGLCEGTVQGRDGNENKNLFTVRTGSGVRAPCTQVCLRESDNRPRPRPRPRLDLQAC